MISVSRISCRESFLSLALVIGLVLPGLLIFVGTGSRAAEAGAEEENVVEIQGKCPLGKMNIDYVTDISISFRDPPEGENLSRELELNYCPLIPEITPSAIAMRGYWSVFANISREFNATVTLYFNHPSFSAFYFDELLVATREDNLSAWAAIPDADFFVVPSDPAAGRPVAVYGVEFTVTEFANYAIVQGIPDLRVTRVHLFASHLIASQRVNISVTVGNFGLFPSVAERVDVLVYCMDSGAEIFPIGFIALGDIRYVEAGEVSGNISWDTPYFRKVDKPGETYLFYARVDPNGSISEWNEKNNGGFLDDTQDGYVDRVNVAPIRNCFCGVPSFASTMGMMLLSTLAIASLAFFRRRRPGSGQKNVEKKRDG